ncbi:MAG TPA: helix-turn-helix domain-containing protein [Pyrinomonadaceae bacterium]
MKEVESLDEKSLPLSETGIPENCDSISFYDEIARFEIALIKSALRRTNGHQLLAARLLNLNPTTLNAKIKQYGLRPPL